MSDWTPDLLKQHFDAELASLKEGVKVALDAANEKSKTHNDILGAMRDQQSTFVTKESVRSAFMALIVTASLATAAYVAFGGN